MSLGSFSCSGPLPKLPRIVINSAMGPMVDFIDNDESVQDYFKTSINIEKEIKRYLRRKYFLGIIIYVKH